MDEDHVHKWRALYVRVQKDGARSWSPVGLICLGCREVDLRQPVAP